MCQNNSEVAWGLTVLNAQSWFCLAGINCTTFRTEANVRLLMPSHLPGTALPAGGTGRSFLQCFLCYCK